MSLPSTLNALNFGAIASYFIGSNPGKISANSFLSNLVSVTNFNMLESGEEIPPEGSRQYVGNIAQDFKEPRNPNDVDKSRLKSIINVNQAITDANTASANEAKQKMNTTRDPAKIANAIHDYAHYSQQAYTHQTRVDEDTRTFFQITSANDPFTSPISRNDYWPDNNSGSYTKPNGEYQGK